MGRCSVRKIKGPIDPKNPQNTEVVLKEMTSLTRKI